MENRVCAFNLCIVRDASAQSFFLLRKAERVRGCKSKDWEVTNPKRMDIVIGRPLKDIIKADKDNKNEFQELLNHAKISPHLSWEAQRDSLAVDPRYLALSSNADRQVAFNEWKQTQASKSSQVDTESSTRRFVEFIDSKYTPGMLYAVFKRKFRNNPEFTNSDIPQNQREALFQEYKMVSNIGSAQEKLEYIETRPLFSMLLPKP